MTIGEQIREYRKQTNMTQKQLSNLTGIAEITIRQYEAGKYNPKMINLQKIADAFNIPVNVLLNMSKNDEMVEALSYFPSATIEEKDGKKRFELLNLKELHTYMLLNEKGRKKALAYIQDLAKLPEYTEEGPPTTE